MAGTIIAEYAAYITFGLVGLVIGIQKLLKSFKDTSVESSVMTMMHTELKRMSDQNKMLSNELNSLQTEIINLNRQLRSLSDENQKLHAEVSSLTSEVGRLRELLNGNNSAAEIAI